MSRASVVSMVVLVAWTGLLTYAMGSTFNWRVQWWIAAAWFILAGCVLGLAAMGFAYLDSSIGDVID